jgi:hypothetical protein
MQNVNCKMQIGKMVGAEVSVEGIEGRGKTEEGSNGAKKQVERDYSVKALECGVRVMIGLGIPEYVELSIKDLAEALSLSVNKTFRILQTLKRYQWVEEVDGKWRIAPAFTQFSEGFRKWFGKKVGELDRLKIEHLG